MSRHRLPIFLATALVFGCSGSTDGPTAQSAGPVTAAAVGGPVHQVTIGGPDVCSGFGAKPGCDANFSLLAMERADGSVTGQWIDRFSQNFGGGGLFVEVDCLAVEGNTAWIGGVVTKPDWAVGLRAITRARDLGTSYALELDDRFTTQYDPEFFGISADCRDEPFFPLLNVPQGQVTIK
jgi:hypothetical protein